MPAIDCAIFQNANWNTLQPVYVVKWVHRSGDEVGGHSRSQFTTFRCQAQQIDGRLVIHGSIDGAGPASKNLSMYCIAASPRFLPLISDIISVPNTIFTPFAYARLSLAT